MTNARSCGRARNQGPKARGTLGAERTFCGEPCALERIHMRKLLVVLMVLMGFTATACNTVKGAGRDIQATGEAVTGAAEETQDDLTDDEP
jgi:predicted small secreted protein